MAFPGPGRASALGLASLAALALSLASPVTAQDPKATVQTQKPERRARAATVQANIRESRRASADFRNPDELKHRSFNNLTLTTGTFPNVHPADVTAPAAFELLCYNGKPVGPTIRVRRGTTFHVELRNELDPSVDAHPNPPNPPTRGFPPNPKAQGAKDLCTTNLHTHGLHVSPANNADNILDVAVGPIPDPPWGRPKVSSPPHGGRPAVPKTAGSGDPRRAPSLPTSLPTSRSSSTLPAVRYPHLPASPLQKSWVLRGVSVSPTLPAARPR
jgi:hypothetical protein